MAQAKKQNNQGRINSITLTEPSTTPANTLIQRDKDIALRDLLDNNIFQPTSDAQGPYTVNLSIEENRLVFRIKNKKEEELPMLVLSLKPYKRLIQDYFLIVRSYDEAMREGKPSG